jgi:dipeptidyl aminopeptidase/acylaminoacyl peptidase
MGNLDADDILALLETAVADDELDGQRVGVMGGSYGGYMTT